MDKEKLRLATDVLNAMRAESTLACVPAFKHRHKIALRKRVAAEARAIAGGVTQADLIHVAGQMARSAA